MSDLHYQQDGTGVEWKYQPSEDKMYVRKYAANYDAVAELAQKVRQEGGTKDVEGFRMVAAIPIEVFSAANDGRSTTGNRYKDFCNYLLKTSRGSLQNFSEDDIKPFMLNDNFQDLMPMHD